jgi:hypothetical protein
MLGDVCFAYHSSIHSSTQETPFFLLYGRDPNIPIHNLLDAIPQSNRSASDFVNLRMESLRIAFQRTKEENEKAREQQREQYNKRVKTLCYRVGDKVLHDVKVRSKTENKKFISKYRGPFRVSKVYDNGTMDITNNSFTTKRVHVNRLRPLYDTMVWRDEFCPDLEDPIILPDPPVPTDVEDQATEEIGEDHMSHPTPEQEDANTRIGDGNMEQLAPFHGWEISESDLPAVETIPDKVANEELPRKTEWKGVEGL